MEARLKEVLEDVNSWLKFAESKNAALIAFDGAFGLALASVVTGSCSLPPAIRVLLHLSIILLAVGALSGLVSFIPRTRIPWSTDRGLNDESDSLLFYGHIARYTPEGYLEAFSRRLGMQVHDFTPLQKDYAEQIVINSKIARYKYRCFCVGVLSTISALVTPVPPLLGLGIHLFYRRKSR